jgi:arylsulfatase
MTLLRTLLSALIVTCVSLSAQDAAMNRTVLPIPEPKYPHITEVDARKAKAPPRFEVKAPADAPNVIII